MDLEDIMTESRWKILSELSHSKKSPTELAEKTGTTLANISSQIKLLEALDFIQKEKISNFEKGKPRKKYSIKKEFAYLVIATKNSIGKKMIRLDNEMMPFFNAWLINDNFSSQATIRAYCENEPLIREANSFGFLGIKGEDLELFFISENPHSLNQLNGKIISKGERKATLKIYAHPKSEVIKGISDKNEYFTALVKRAHILFDKESLISRLKKGEFVE